MLSNYIAHVIRALDKAKVMPVEQIQKVTGLDPHTYDRVIQGTNGQHIRIENVDRLVEFFGMGIFSSGFVKESFVSSNSQYKTWEGLDTDEQLLINVAGVYTTTSKSPISSLNYTKECAYFLETCDTLISIIKDTGANDDDGTDDGEDQQ
jgi:hypothetical protein